MVAAEAQLCACRRGFTDVLKEFGEKPMCEIYGAEHLLRLFGTVLLVPSSIPCVPHSPPMREVHPRRSAAELASAVRHGLAVGPRAWA